MTRRTCVGLPRATLAAALITALIAALAGCSDDPSPGPGPSSSPSGSSASGSSVVPSSGAPSADAARDYPVVVEPQALRIGAAVDTALAAALTARDVTAAKGRVAGPAAQLLAAQLVIAKARAGDPPPATPLTPSRLLVPRAAGWPRWFVAAGTVAGQAVPTVRVLVSPSAREPYALWADLSLLPGATLPEAETTPAGVPTLSPTAAGLSLTPAEVATRYADVLNRGRASSYLSTFADDDFRTQLNSRLAADRKQVVATAVATITSTHTVAKGTGYTLRTADGGGLVIVELRHAYQVRVESGRGAVKADADLAALAGTAVFGTRLDRSAVEVLAFAVPPRGSTEPVQLIAASKGDVSATGE